ncbi:hypothetical protein ABH920_009504 [Catenulispora sp. EB89]
MSAPSAEEHEFSVRVTFPRFGKLTRTEGYLAQPLTA